MFTATFNRKDLEEAVGLCLPAVATSNQLEIIKGIRLNVHDLGKKVSFTAFDLAKGIITVADAIAEGSGSIVIPGAKLLQAVRNLTGDTVTITAADNGKCNIKSGKSRVTVPFLDGKDFPNIPMIMGDGDFVIPKKELVDAMRETVYAADKGNSRAVLNGVSFDFTQNGSEVTLHLSGSNSYRFACCTRRLTSKDNKTQSGKAIVPTEVVLQYIKLLDSSAGETVQILLTSKHLIMIADGFTFFTRLIDGQYVDLEKVIGQMKQQPSHTEVVVSTEELRGALARAALVTEERQVGAVKPYVRLETTDNGMLFVTAEAANDSTYDELEAEITGNPVTIGFNNAFLMDAIKVIHTEKVRISLTTASSAALVRPEGTDNGEDQTHLVMPVRMTK